MRKTFEQGFAPPTPSREAGEVEARERARAAAKELILLSSQCVVGRRGSVSYRLGEYTLRHPDLEPAMREFFWSLTSQCRDYELDLDRLLPPILGITEGEYRELLTDISNEVDEPRHTGGKP